MVSGGLDASRLEELLFSWRLCDSQDCVPALVQASIFRLERRRTPALASAFNLKVHSSVCICHQHLFRVHEHVCLPLLFTFGLIHVKLL